MCHCVREGGSFFFYDCAQKRDEIISLSMYSASEVKNTCNMNVRCCPRVIPKLSLGKKKKKKKKKCFSGNG